MVHTPLISIITPALNASSTLAQAIESVRAQNIIGPHFSGWEMIIVDDYSQDSTIALAAHMAEQDERIRVIRCAENGGAARARNKGLDAARGRYIAFLDADDVWLPHKLQQQLDSMNDTQAALSTTYYRRFTDVTKPRRLQKLRSALSFNDMVRYAFPALSTIIIDRQQTGAFQFDENLAPSEDWAAWLALTKSGYDIHTVPQDLARVRVRHGGGFIETIHHVISITKTYRRIAGLRVVPLLGALMRYGYYAMRKRLF